MHGCITFVKKMIGIFVEQLLTPQMNGIPHKEDSCLCSWLGLFHSRISQTCFSFYCECGAILVWLDFTLEFMII